MSRVTDEQPKTSPNAGNTYKRLTEQISVMLTRDDREWIETQAAREGVSRGDVVRQAITALRDIHIYADGKRETELPGMWEAADFTGGADEVRP
jgi:Arc/MetJ-type ribon-helix-helix transcriptional regulator